MKYKNYAGGRFSKGKELIEFLKMVKLKEKKLQWTLNQKDKTNKELAFICGINVRRFQQLKAEYKRTGEIPMLKKERRSKTELTEEEKKLIDKAVEESRLNGAVTLRLYIDKYYNKKIAYGKIHKYILYKGISKPDKKKQRQRKYCEYERKHRFSLGHTDVHESKVIPGKQVISWIDDASRKILAGGEFDHATSKNSFKVFKQSLKYGIPKQLHSDNDSAFRANEKEGCKKGESWFEQEVKKLGVQQIFAKAKHPQSNGKMEKLVHTIKVLWKKTGSFEKAVKHYNYKRPHRSLTTTDGKLRTPYQAFLDKMRK